MHIDGSEHTVFVNGNKVRLLWTLQDFMRATGFSRSFIYTERERGNIVLRKAAGRTVILKEDVDAYLSKLAIAV